MQYADVQGVRVEATTGMAGECPACHAPVVARCGEVNVWHWAHETECTIQSEPETAWHRAWKERFPKEYREVVLADHRADVIYRGTVYEFQRRPLEPTEYAERTAFWERHGFTVRWVFYHADHPETFVLRMPEHSTRDFMTFRWKWAKRRLADVATPFYIDGGWEDPFLVRRIYWDEKVGGWGVFQKITV